MHVKLNASHMEITPIKTPHLIFILHFIFKGWKKIQIKASHLFPKINSWITTHARWKAIDKENPRRICGIWLVSLTIQYIYVIDKKILQFLVVLTDLRKVAQ